MGQLSVEKPVLPGSVLSGNQHLCFERRTPERTTTLTTLATIPATTRGRNRPAHKAETGTVGATIAEGIAAGDSRSHVLNGRRRSNDRGGFFMRQSANCFGCTCVPERTRLC